jgi:hypothetical protein
MRTVYIAQRQPTFDMNPAMMFGELKTVMPTGAQAYFAADEFVHIAREKLKNATPDDYLILTGDPVMMAICFSVMAEMTGGSVRCLKWDRRKGTNGGYVQVSVNMESQPSY